jgi:outer membrane receptor protein involved in Fe transport
VAKYSHNDNMTDRERLTSVKYLLAIVFFAITASAAVPRDSLHIEGVVVDQNGAPVNQAQVSLKRGARVIAATTTDANGEFKFAAEYPENLLLVIDSTGFATAELQLGPVPSSSLRIVLQLQPLAAQVTISATRTETRLSDTAASVVVLNSTDLKTTAAVTLDDALRQVAGFSLFRRSGSRTANPTSQGVSLRGLGASGASRAVVLADGVPLNDPFGGWVYWDRVPRESIRQVEVLLGPASYLYGSAALGGMIDISTRKPDTNTVSLSASYGNQNTPNASLYVAGVKDGWAASLAAETFNTDGYVLVPGSQRGPIDTAAGSRNAVVTPGLEKSFGARGRLFGRATFFGESRKNGTPLQTNRTHLRQFALGGEMQRESLGHFSALVYGGTQLFDQNFTAVSADRNSETITRVQRVPAQVLGVSGQWSRAFGQRQTLVAGLETQEVQGASDELAFVNGRASAYVDAGGRQRTTGVYIEDLARITSAFSLSAGARWDHWQNFAAFSAARPINASNPTNVVAFPNRAESAFSPQLSATYQVNRRVQLVASMARGFRSPTLNELYRSFRVGNVLTLANENLKAERLTGGEAGARLGLGNDKFLLRGTFFWNDITRPVANVTLQTTPALITRQRQNLGRTRSRGVELQADAAVNRYWTISAGYLFADAKVVEFAVNRTLEGLLIPQVAPQQFTFQVRYNNPSLLTVAFQGRAASKQFDDDQNLFRLDPYFTLDLFVSRRLNRRLELFCAVENLFNERYQIGKTPLITLGPPLLVRAGFKLRLGSK